MLRIAITPPEIRRDECEYISTILDAGWERVHLRHPSADRDTIKSILDGLKAEHRGRVKLHSHFDLAEEYGLCGIHLNLRNGVTPHGFSGEISKSLHTLSELEPLKNDFNGAEAKEAAYRLVYVTLSPIFHSISKQGYSQEWDKEMLRRSLASTEVPVIALGGVTPDKTDWIKKAGFTGYAVLGYLNAATNMAELHERLQEFDN